MAASSITKNFVISGKRQMEMFADALEASADDKTPRVPINITYLQGADDIMKFMEKRKENTTFEIAIKSNNESEACGRIDIFHALFYCEKKW